MSEPAGIVMPFAGSTAPQGYLLCDGSAVSRDTYSSLFTAIGTVYGAGDGSSTFNVPNLSGRVVLGVSQSHAMGTTGGEETHTLTESELSEHSHVVPSHGHSNNISAKTPVFSHTVTQPAFNYNRPNSFSTGGSGGGNVINGTTTATASVSTNAAVAAHAASDCTMSGTVTDCSALTSGSTGSNTSHSNMQPFLTMSYIISTGL